MPITLPARLGVPVCMGAWGDVGTARMPVIFAVLFFSGTLFLFRLYHNSSPSQRRSILISLPAALRGVVRN